MTNRRGPLRWLGRALLILIGVFGALVVIGAIAGRLRETESKTPPLGSLPAPSGQDIAPGALVFDSDRSGNFEVYTAHADGTEVRQLTNDPSYDTWWGRISPDRRRILFHRTPKGVHDTDYSKVSLWVMNADGSGIVEIRPVRTDGWRMQGHAEWSPDGTQIVMFGGSVSNPQIFITSASGAEPRKVTNRGGTNLDPSWSPDGTTIVFVGCGEASCTPKDYEIFTVPAAGGEAQRLTRDGLRDQDPYFSPDGGQLAWLTEISSSPPIWDIRISDTAGTNPRRVVNDKGINSRPEWARDSSVIFFHRLSPGRDRFQLFSINPDGTNLHEITKGQPGVNEYPSA